METTHVPAHTTLRLPADTPQTAVADGGDATYMDDQTWGNKHIDCSEPGARVTIAVTGRDWTLENIAITGGMAHTDGVPYAFDVSADDGATGVLRNVWLGDSPQDGADAGGIHVRADHAGDLAIEAVTIERQTREGIHASDATDGQVSIERAYLAANGVANCRAGAPTTTLNDCVLRTPAGTPGDRHRGLYRESGNDITVTDCHIAVHADDYAIEDTGLAAVQVSGGAVDGTTTGNIEREDVGDHPQTYTPAGAPRTPSDAATRPGTESESA